MKRFAVRCAVVAALGVAMVIYTNSVTPVAANNADDDVPIKTVMKKVNVDGLCAAINKGVGNNKKFAVDTPKWDELAEKAKELVPLAKALGKNKPPMGSEESWKKYTSAYAKAAEDFEAAVKDKNQDKAKAAAAVIANCAGCHKEHRPPKKDK
jgi:cytochrome c556